MAGDLLPRLERHLLQVTGGGMDDQLADFRRAGECDLVHVRMRGDRGAGRAVTGDDIDHAWREAGFLDQLAETYRGEGCLFGRLQHDRASRRECRRDLPDRHQQREVPRDDLPDHTHRFAQAVSVPIAGCGDRNALAGDLGGPTAHVAQQFAAEGHIDRPRVADGLAVIERFQFREFVGVGFENVAELPHQFAAVGRLHLRPRAGFESPPCRFHRRVDIFGAAFSDLAICCPFDGSNTAKVLPDFASTHFPSISSLWRRAMNVRSLLAQPAMCRRCVHGRASFVMYKRT